VTHRAARLAAPDGMYPQVVEFVDAAHGYAQYVTREPVSGTGSADPDDLRHRAALFATADGGRTWTALRHPRAVSANPQLYVVDASTLVLLTEPYGWYVSADGGRSYRHDPPDPTGQYLPPEYERGWQSPRGTLRLDCPNEACVVSRVDAGGAVTPVSRQPSMPVPVRALAEQAGGLAWVAGTDGAGRPHVQVSADGGGTWRSVVLPAQGAHGGDGDGAFDWLDLQASPDGADVWLVGYPRQGVGGGGGASAPGAALSALKVVGMPLLWRAVGDAMVSRGLSARPTTGPTPPLYTVAAIGGGLLAVSGPGCFCLVDEAWVPGRTPQPIEYLRVLPDGTVVGSAITNRTIYLGTRTGRDLGWVELELG
jgi:hypothetical protein